jgi:hypothetical protein
MWLVGFRDTDFVVWNLSQSYELLRHPCGGGKRPFDLAFDTDSLHNYTFAFGSQGMPHHAALTLTLPTLLTPADSC